MSFTCTIYLERERERRESHIYYICVCMYMRAFVVKMLVDNSFVCLGVLL